MEWFLVTDAPATSNTYLVWAEWMDYPILAKYSYKTKRWTVGEGLDREAIIVQQWAFRPEPQQSRRLRVKNVSRSCVKQILLKDLVVRTVVAFEGSHTTGLSDAQVKEVLRSVASEDNDDDVNKLLDAMYEFHKAVQNW